MAGASSVSQLATEIDAPPPVQPIAPSDFRFHLRLGPLMSRAPFDFSDVSVFTFRLRLIRFHHRSGRSFHRFAFCSAAGMRSARIDCHRTQNRCRRSAGRTDVNIERGKEAAIKVGIMVTMENKRKMK